MTTHSTQPGGTAGFAWGYNNAGGLGNGCVARALRPVPVHLPEGTVDVQGGTDFTAALTSAGEVWTWGGNRYGQLGHGTTRVRFAPAQVQLPRAARVESISVGPDYVLALTRHGGVFAWGRNSHGQLGDGSTTDRHAPVQINVQRVTRLATGITSSVAVTRSGGLLCWGRRLLTLTGVGAAQRTPADLLQPTAHPLPHGTTAAIIDAGARHLVVLTTEGELLTYGVGPDGKPLPPSLPTNASWGKITSISVGDNHTVALTDTGTVLTWGANYHGQLGTRDTTSRPTPVPVRIPKLRGHITAVAAGGDTVLAASSEHQVYAWGHGGFGQIGTGHTGDQTRPHPVHIPDEATVTGIHTGRYHNLATTSQH